MSSKKSNSKKLDKDLTKSKTTNAVKNSIKAKNVKSTKKSDSVKKDSNKKATSSSDKASKSQMKSSSSRKNTKVQKNTKKLEDISILKLATIILGSIFVILLVVFFILSGLHSQENNNDEDEVLKDTTLLYNMNDLNIEDLTLYVLLNEECVFCLEEQVASDLIQILNISSSSIEYITHNSSKATVFKEELAQGGLVFEFSPLFLVSPEIQVHPLFAQDEFNSLFIQSGNVFILNPQITQVKYLDENFILPEEVISVGNSQGVQVTYISDYFCERCKIMEGVDLVVEDAKNKEVLPDNFSAPILNLLTASFNVISQDDLTFNLNYIPAAVHENATLAHKSAYCAYKQNEFVPMHTTLLYTANVSMTKENYFSIAQNLNLDMKSFELCFNSQLTQQYIDSNKEYLIELGVSSLPVLIIGKYPITNIIDADTVELLLKSQVEGIIEN